MQTYPVVLQFCNFNVLKPIQKQTSSTNFWLSIVRNPRLPLFPLLCTVIGLENHATLSTNQMQNESQSLISHTFSCHSGRLHMFLLSSYNTFFWWIFVITLVMVLRQSSQMGSKLEFNIVSNTFLHSSLIFLIFFFRSLLYFNLYRLVRLVSSFKTELSDILYTVSSLLFCSYLCSTRHYRGFR